MASNDSTTSYFKRLYNALAGRKDVTFRATDSVTGNEAFRFVRLGDVNSNFFAGGNFSTLIEHGYEKSVDGYAVINAIAKPASAIPWIVKRDGEIIEDTPIHELMSRPNPLKLDLTWQQVIYQNLIYLCSVGNTFTVGIEIPGFGSRFGALDILPAGQVQVNATNNFFDPVASYTMTLEKTYNFEREKVMHIKFMNPDYLTTTEQVYGLAPLAVAKYVIQTGLDRWKADSAILQNKGGIGYITDRSEDPMDATEVEALQQLNDSRIGGANNFGKILVTNKDLQFVQTAMSTVDLGLLDKDPQLVRAFCNVLGLPSEILNDPANKTFNNRKEANKSRWEDAIMPLMNQMAAHFNTWLVPNLMPNESGVTMQPDFSSVEALQEDKKERAEIWIKLKEAGIQTANQAARALADLGVEENPDDNADKLVISSRNAALVEQLEDLNDAEIQRLTGEQNQQTEE